MRCRKHHDWAFWLVVYVPNTSKQNRVFRIILIFLQISHLNGKIYFNHRVIKLRALDNIYQSIYENYTEQNGGATAIRLELCISTCVWSSWLSNCSPWMDLDTPALNGVVAVVLGRLVVQRRRRGWIHRQPLASLALALLARADLIFRFYFWLFVCFLYFDSKSWLPGCCNQFRSRQCDIKATFDC